MSTASDAAHEILTEHWLIVDMQDRDRIVGCHCGFSVSTADGDYDFGDEVLAHILGTAHNAWISGGGVTP